MTIEGEKLRIETIMWRWFVAFLLIFFIGITVLGFIFSGKNEATINTHWNEIKIKQDRIIGITNKNYQMLVNNDNHLRECVSCHSHHPKIKGDTNVQ
jgi:hypothetical protein